MLELRHAHGRLKATRTEVPVAQHRDIRHRHQRTHTCRVDQNHSASSGHGLERTARLGEHHVVVPQHLFGVLDGTSNCSAQHVERNVAPLTKFDDCIQVPARLCLIAEHCSTTDRAPLSPPCWIPTQIDGVVDQFDAIGRNARLDRQALETVQVDRYIDADSDIGRRNVVELQAIVTNPYRRAVGKLGQRLDGGRMVMSVNHVRHKWHQIDTVDHGNAAGLNLRSDTTRMWCVHGHVVTAAV